MQNITAMSFPTSVQELEALIRGILREEIGAFLRGARAENELEDEALARDALAILAADRDRPEAWIDWEEAKAELRRAEAAGELPD